MRDRVAFDWPVEEPDGSGGLETGWSLPGDALQRSAEFIYLRGSEGVDAARLAGRSVFKVRLRADAETRAIETDWRMRDLRRGTAFNVREVDAVTDALSVYLVVESGVAS